MLRTIVLNSWSISHVFYLFCTTDPVPKRAELSTFDFSRHITLTSFHTVILAPAVCWRLCSVQTSAVHPVLYLFLLNFVFIPILFALCNFSCHTVGDWPAHYSKPYLGSLQPYLVLAATILWTYLILRKSHILHAIHFTLLTLRQYGSRCQLWTVILPKTCAEFPQGQWPD